MTTNRDWNGKVGASWAENYRATDRALSGLTEQLLDTIRPYRARQILDVGSGAGELSLSLARERPDAQIVGLDISPDLVTAARQRSDRRNVQFIQTDAQVWRSGEFEADLVVSRHGVMFFGNPVAAFENLRRGAARGAALCFSCFRSPGENPWASEPAALFGRDLPAKVADPGPFAFSDRDAVSGLLGESGWHDIRFRRADFAFIAGTGERAVEEALAFFTRIGPGARAIAERNGVEREAAMAQLEQWIGRHAASGMVALPAAAWIVTASA